MHRRILLFILIGFSFSPIIAQRSLSVPGNTISSSNTSTGKIYWGNRNEPPRAIEFKERTVTISYFLANINQYFNIPAEFTFIETESNTDNLGMRHRRVQQYYKGILLEGMGYRVHEKNGFVTSANGKAVRDIKLDMQVILSEEQAFHLAKKYLQTKDTTVRSGKKLIVSKGFTFSPESFSIAFQFDIDVSLIEQWRISIDARNGEPINKVSLVNTCFKEEEGPPLPYSTGTGLTNYYGNKTVRVEKLENGGSRLVGKTEHGGSIGTYNFANASYWAWVFDNYTVYNFYSANNTFNLWSHKEGVSVQWAAEQAYEYYFKKHNRNSYNNSGAAITCYVHVGDSWSNAAWSRNTLLFGDGSNNNNPLVELDVVAHELTHGVTQFEADLQYYSESGALNESFSDIFAKAVEFYTFGDDTATWQLARHYQTGGLRDLSNPNLRNQPDTYQGNLWFTGTADEGGVHYNSGVQNFWFYLLCNGGSGVNDLQMSYSINSIGMEGTVNIAYRNLTQYLDRFSDYSDSRIGSLLATADLFGINSTEYQQVGKAWDAVGVIDQPIITNLELYDITASTVKIRSNLLPRGDTVTYHFEYGTTPAFGSSSPIYKYTDRVEGILKGLQGATKYYFRLVVTNEKGSSYATREFTTLSPVPLVKIKETVDVTETTAILYGAINPNSLPGSFYFEYGPTPALGSVTPSHPISDTIEFLNVSASIIGLQPRQTYYYRLIATNGFASAATESVYFFTAIKPVISSYTPASGPIDAVVTITGQNFNPTLEKNLVSFGATRATVLSSSSTEIKVKVPAGASLGQISLLDAESSLATESVKEFVPTFDGDYKKGNLKLTIASTELIYEALVQDMDGDKKPDIVVRQYLGFSVFMNVNQGGDVTKESFVRSSFLNSEVTPATLTLIDFDGNGLKDVIVSHKNKTRIYPNFSVPGYVFFGAPVELPINIGLIRGIAYNDFDQDGRVDLAIADYATGDSTLIRILRNQNPKGSLSSENFVEQFSMAVPYSVFFFYSEDLNNDGKPELFSSALTGSAVNIIKNNSRPGVFEFEENSDSGNLPIQGIGSYFSQDLNQDGWKDIITHLAYQAGNAAILENKGTSPDITLENPVVLLNERVDIIRPGDINGDGKVDLLVGDSNGKFTFLKNNAGVNDPVSGSSFEKFDEYGIVTAAKSNGSSLVINDLNGDGKPEIISAYPYGDWSGSNMLEIWQNTPVSCPDPSLITLDVARYSATIILPPNTTLDQFQIEWANEGAPYWYPVHSTTLSLSAGRSYQLRARAKCYLDFTEYYYINFATACVDVNSFYISSIGINTVTIEAYELYNFEIQYSKAGEDRWITHSQWNSQINNLTPGTTYDIRFRGRCNTTDEFKYKQFTTLCPKLSSLNITEIVYNQAVVNPTNYHAGNVILEYSADNINWILIDETRTMYSLTPGKSYFVRGKLECTNLNSDFIYKSFTTPCPEVSTLYVDAITPISAMINWTDESNTGSYTLTYGMTDGAITTIETNSTSFSLVNLKPGTHYTVSVAPNCIRSKDFTSTSFSSACYAPLNLSANPTHTTVELSWNDNFNGGPYFIDYSISGSNVWIATQTVLTNLSLTELRPGTEYEVRVHISCTSETPPYVNLLFETQLYEETRFAPNPTKGEITIYPSKDLIGHHFTIYDNVGKEVANGELLDYTIDLSVFSHGMYTLKIEGEKTMRVIKH